MRVDIGQLEREIEGRRSPWKEIRNYWDYYSGVGCRKLSNFTKAIGIMRVPEPTSNNGHTHKATHSEEVENIPNVAILTRRRRNGRQLTRLFRSSILIIFTFERKLSRLRDRELGNLNKIRSRGQISSGDA